MVGCYEWQCLWHHHHWNWNRLTSRITKKEGDSNVFYVNITWTPTTEQENITHLFRYTDINSADLSSTEVCITHLLDTLPPIMLIHLVATTWRIIFIECPSTTAYITFDVVRYFIIFRSVLSMAVNICSDTRLYILHQLWRRSSN